jgi:Ca2+-binding RTX toxin-like protein
VTPRSCILAAALAGLLLTLVPAAAGAAARFAAPGGSGTACSQGAPCDIQTAVEAPAVTNGDEVVLAPGTYHVGNDPVVAGKAIYLHGTAGAPMPLIATANGFSVVIGSGAAIEDVEVHASAPGLGIILTPGSRAERIVSIASANDASSCLLQPSVASPPLIRQSACVATGTGGTGVLASAGVSAGTHSSARMENVTAVATGAGSTGVESASTGGGGSVTLQGLNVIASGTAADLSAKGSATGSIAFAQLTFSNFDSQAEGPNSAASDPGSDANVTGPALLANPAAGDVHQRPGSFTIDRGSKAAQGVDIDGEPRYQGEAPDIGADELAVKAQRRKCFGRAGTLFATPGGSVIGTRGRDVIVGTSGRDKILSKGGNDLVCSLGGADVVRAGPGADRVRASGGADKVLGEGGGDRIQGGGGRDRLKGGAGKDRLAGQAGRDRLAGGGGRDRCGSAPKDRVSGCE